MEKIIIGRQKGKRRRKRIKTRDIDKATITVWL